MHGLISGTDPYLLEHDDWDQLGSLYRQMHPSLEVLKVGWSTSELMDQLPRMLEAIRVGTKMVSTTLYATTLHFRGGFGGSYTRPGGPMERVWRLTSCSGVAKWLDIPMNDDDITRILAEIRSYKAVVDKTANTHLLFIVLETYSWGTLKPHLTGFLARVATLCRSLGIAVVADETSTGLGIMGDGNYFGFQHDDYGFIPDVMVAGNQAVLSVLTLNLHGGNPLIANYRKLELQMVMQNVSTVFADSHAIQRTTAVLSAILADDAYLQTGQQLTQELPGLLEEHGLSVPTGGGGFVWKFELGNLSHAFMPITDGFGVMRLSMDSTIASVRATIELMTGM
jgi:hypothetical protein